MHDIPGGKTARPDFTEDHLSPGYFECTLSPGQPVVLWAGPVSKQDGVRISRLLDGRDQMELEEWCQGLPCMPAGSARQRLPGGHGSRPAPG